MGVQQNHQKRDNGMLGNKIIIEGKGMYFTSGFADVCKEQVLSLLLWTRLVDEFLKRITDIRCQAMQMT